MLRDKTRKLVAAFFLVGMFVAFSSCYSTINSMIGSSRLLQGSCPSSTTQPSQNITGPDGHSPMCLLGVDRKPDRLKWSLDGNTLAYELRLQGTMQGKIYILNADGKDRNSFDNSHEGVNGNPWTLSPDGQYLILTSCMPSMCNYGIIQTWTGLGIGSGWKNTTCCSPWQRTGPALLEMSGGRWWSPDYPDIVLKANNPNLVSARIWPVISPDGRWIIGVNSEEGYIASLDGKIMNYYLLPGSKDPIMSSADYCSGYPGEMAWSPDSKMFAIFDVASKRQALVWTVEGEGNVHFSQTVTLTHCPIDLTLSNDGQVTAAHY